MRITTKVIQNNSLNNINTNKLLQDKLSQQMSTEKKVTRPSDDPIVAIRALRLRTNVNQINQYYEKNVPDAESWLEVTEGALSSMSEVITDMIAQCTKGSNEDLTTDDRDIILTALKALRDEVYSTGNSDYAGRYIFTGYRTDTALTFTENEKQEYSITEQIDKSKIDTVTYVETGELLDINESNYWHNGDGVDDAGNAIQDEKEYHTIIEQQVVQSEVHRLRLSYEDVKAIADANGDPVADADGNIDLGIQVFKQPVTDANGNQTLEFQDIKEVLPDVTYKIASLYDDPNPYEQMTAKDIDGNLIHTDANTVILVKETGEMLLGENVFNELMAKTDEPGTTYNEGEIRLNYKKENWKDGDLRPEHYFACTTVTEEGQKINFNEDYLQGISDEDKQTIEYDVGLNQVIRVNTTADEIFRHDIGRDVDDLIKSLEDTIAMEKQVTKLKKMVEENKNENYTPILKNQLAAMEKAFALLNEKTQQLFEGGITKMQGHLDAVNFAVTENGTRGQKLELISNRLMSQKTNFETLKSENEDIDITEVAIKLSSAELTYSSALMATGKVLQNNLMNFI